MYQVDHIKYTLRFHQPAGTSRGTLQTKDSWILRISEKKNPSRFGLGEVSLIPGLSPDDPEKLESILNDVSEALQTENNATGRSTSEKSSGTDSIPKDPLTRKEIPGNASAQNDALYNNNTLSIPGIDLTEFPAVMFGIETALRDLETGGKRLLYPSGFTDGDFGLPINGLIWMGNRQDMLQQVNRKLTAGFRIIKLKVGALNFEDELELLRTIRKEYTASDLEIRLDANGAWSPSEAPGKLTRLAEFAIHSLEQPIPAGYPAEMAGICKASPIPVALDEELIGVWESGRMKQLLEVIRPSYIILKPSLLGGIRKSAEWIRLAEAQGIGWWLTSALESNIGLNAIAQWTATLDTKMPQGLGTGSLYENNIPSPLMVIGDRIHYLPGETWDLSGLTFTR